MLKSSLYHCKLVNGNSGTNNGGNSKYTVALTLERNGNMLAGMNATATADGFAIFQITISVKDSQQLDQVMRKIHQISGVMKVNRPAG